MMRPNWHSGLFLAISLLAASPASAAVVAEITDPVDDGAVFEDAFRTFPSVANGNTTSTITASDGNKVLALYYPNYSGSNFTNGYVWDLAISNYTDALGTTGSLQNGWVVRQSAWLAMDPNDPLLNEGTWTESFKFEFARSFGGQGGAEYFDTGSLIPVKFTPYNCDIGAGTCGSPGDGFQISTTQWTQISMQYEIDDLDFTGFLEDLVEARPVLFLGDYTTGEQKQGTLFIDNIVVEVFADLASANATSLPANEPGGIPDGSTGRAGDFNGDGDVNGDDFLIWQRGESPNGAGLADLAHWQTNYGAAATAARPVPEPAAALLAACAGGLLLWRRPCRTRRANRFANSR